MSKAEEFSLLYSAWKKAWEVESDQIGMPITDERESELSDFVTDHGDLIARALRTQESIDESLSDSLGFDFTAKLGEAAVHAVKDNLVSDAARGLRILAAFREAVK